jgi:hypothetical protein
MRITQNDVFYVRYTWHPKEDLDNAYQLMNSYKAHAPSQNEFLQKIMNTKRKIY